MPSQLPPCRATALFIALTLQKGKRSFSPSLSVCLSILIVFFGVFYFLNVLIPHLEGELRLSPQLLWQPLFASEKVHLKGPTKCATTCLGIVFHLASTENMGMWKTGSGSSELVVGRTLFSLFYCYIEFNSGLMDKFTSVYHQSLCAWIYYFEVMIVAIVKPCLDSFQQHIFPLVRDPTNHTAIYVRIGVKSNKNKQINKKKTIKLLPQTDNVFLVFSN